MTRERTRPDTSGKPGYITPEGYRRFEEEADRLWNIDRPKMAKAVQVAAAETVAVVGISGSGKSTLLRMMTAEAKISCKQPFSVCSITS